MIRGHRNIFKTKSLKSFSVEMETTTLENGARLVVFERPNTPVYANAIFLAGSRFDPAGKEGIGHFLEHLLVAGTKSFQSKDKLASFAERLGGTIGAYTNVDTLTLETSVGNPRDLSSVIKILSEEITNSLFLQKVIDTERGSILQEISDSKTIANKHVNEISKENVFQGTVLAHSGLGTESSVVGITRDDLISHRDQFIFGNNTAIVVAGGVKAEEITEAFSNNLILPKGEKPKLLEDLPIIRDKTIRIENSSIKGDSVYISFDFRTPGILNPEVRPLSMLSAILGGGRASILAKRLRYDNGFVYFSNAQQTSYLGAGVFSVRTACANKNLEKVITIIAKEINKIAKNGPTKEDLQQIKDKTINSALVQMQTSGSWVIRHAYRALIDPSKMWAIDNYFDEVLKVSVDDIKDCAKKFLTHNNWYLSLYGNTNNINEDKISDLIITTLS